MLVHKPAGQIEWMAADNGYFSTVLIFHSKKHQVAQARNRKNKIMIKVTSVVRPAS